MVCIFCRNITAGTHVEHVLPESLGGKNWACLPAGRVCDTCNQYFGAKVEPAALGSFPLLPLRLIFGIPTKKGKPATMQHWLGELRGNPMPGAFGLNPASPEIEQAILEGKVTQLRIIAEPSDSLAVARLLLKMGLETLSFESAEEALHPAFDAARQFARAPSRPSEWWYALCTNHDHLFDRMQNGVSWEQWTNEVALQICNIQGGTMFVFRYLGMTLITPLSDNIVPSDKDEDWIEPEKRLFYVRC